MCVTTVVCRVLIKSKVASFSVIVILSFRENYLRLDIYYQELSYTRVTQQKSFEILSLLSEIGGFLGLLLGASILTVCELVDFLFLKACTKAGN